MRILQVVPYFPPSYAFGGPVRSVYYISKELAKRGHEVTVYTTDALNLTARITDKISFKDINVFYFKNVSMLPIKLFKFFLTPDLILKARKDFSEKRFDVVHLHEFRSFQNIVVAYFANKYKVPYIIQARGSLPRKTNREFFKLVFDIIYGEKLLRNASRAIALSPIEKKYYARMGVPLNKINIVPNGLDIEVYRHLPQSNSFKKKYHIEDQKKIILYLGRINKLKGIDFLVRAYKILIHEYKIKDVLLVISGPDDGYLYDLKNLVNKLGLTNHVMFTGALYGKDKLAALVDATVCVYPNPLEPFGLVPLEAAACMTPSIVSKGTYMAQIIEKEKFGFVVNYNDVIELSKLLLRFVNNNALSIDLGRRGREVVFKKFNWSNIIQRLEDIYYDLAEIKKH